MIKYIFRRFLELLLALFLIATATFFLTAAAPGDPLVSRTMSLPQASRDAMYAKYGLDKPLMQRYVITMKGMLHGDFGESVVYEGQTLQDIIREKLPVSARLGLQSLIFGVLVGLFLGVIAAEALGERPLKIIVRHLLPNIMGILILEVATAIPGYIFQEAGLSFIGLGLKAPSISLGLLISNGQAVMNSHVNQLIFPALVLCIMVLAFNLLGDGLRNALDPKFRK